MILAFLTTMNSKVKVHVVDGSKCVLDCSHDKEEPGPSRPTSCRSAEVLSGPLRKKQNRVWGRGRRTRSRQRRPKIAKRGCRAAWWLTMA